MDIVVNWLLQYGSIILFMLLALGIIGLPIPDETLLFIAGWLISKGQLSLFSTASAALAGSIFGISVSYWLGVKTGTWLVHKYGRRLRITPERLEKVHRWYEKIGKWTLLIGYFVPVLRHLTGYVAGSTKLSYRQFMLFAYVGALIWSFTFLSLGYFIRTEVQNVRGLYTENTQEALDYQ